MDLHLICQVFTFLQMIGPSVDLCLLRSRAPFYWDGLESTRPGN